MYKQENVFFNTRLSLYHIVKSGPKYLELVSVPDIQFYPDRLLFVEGILPYRRDLLEIEDGAEFVLVYSDCALASRVFDNTTPVIRFTNCKVKQKNIFDSVNRSDERVVCASIVFECDISIPEWGL